MEQETKSEYATTEKVVKENPPYETARIGEPWVLGIFKRFPWRGLLALVGVAICSLGPVAILKDSDGKPTATWPDRKHPIQPAVLLSICAAVGNTLLRYALFQGWTIAWWVEALRGSTVGDLHRHWEYGTSVLASITSARHFNRIALATLIASIVVIDGPLLQKATSSTTQSLASQANITVQISPNSLPVGYTAVMTGHSGTVFPKFDFIQDVMTGFNSRTAIQLNYTGCNGVCNTTLQAAGFDVHCSHSTQPYNVSEYDAGTSYGMGSTNITFNGDGYDGLIRVKTAYKSTPGCIGNLVVSDCQYNIAQVNYPVLLSNGTVDLLPAGANDTIKVWQLYQEVYGLGQWPSTLGGIWSVAHTQYESSTSFYIDGTPLSLMYTGAIPIQYLVANSSTLGTCDMYWTDPTPDIISGIRELGFRTAIVATNITTNQIFEATEIAVVQVYVSHYHYLGGALLVMLLGVVLVFPTFLGWWQLGRKMSLSPIEIAKAFNAPLLEGFRSNREVKKILKEAGELEVVYGEVVMPGSEGEKKSLQMANPEFAIRPRANFTYDG
ncbi:hypothetical protein V8E51_015855 [Hyaloscypha variabilis]